MKSHPISPLERRAPGRPRIRAAVLASTLGLLLSPAWASDNIEPITDALAASRSAGLGLVTRVERSPYAGAGVRYDLLPLYIYESERFFLRGNRAGAKLLSDGAHHLDLFVERRLEGFPTDRVPDSLAGMSQRDAATDVGLAYRMRQPWGTLRAELMRDAGSTHNGAEARLGYSYDWRSGPWTLQPSLMFALRDASLNNYYFGVSASEATVSRPAYTAGAGLNATLGLHASYELTQRWRLLSGVSVTRLDSTVRNSSIVQKSVLPSVYLGAAYDFGGQPARQPDAAASPTYFKLLYGKATEDGCHLVKIISAQCFEVASNNATSITGVQVGKPLIQNLNGWPVDVAGYVGLTHHNDQGLQPNGLQLDLFVKGIYSGFPWSHRVKTRLGLGVGISVAQRVPYAEASSQGPGEPTSRLLNYLDPTLDVSLGDLLGSRALKDTFIGVGVSHRSGIFGSSRLLGNVNGGSNYIYTYVETAL